MFVVRQTRRACMMKKANLRPAGKQVGDARHTPSRRERRRPAGQLSSKHPCTNGTKLEPSSAKCSNAIDEWVYQLFTLKKQVHRSSIKSCNLVKTIEKASLTQLLFFPRYPKQDKTCVCSILARDHAAIPAIRQL
jgi:hypothetical protein